MHTPFPARGAGHLARDLVEEAHHSTAIEGNTLVLKQVELLLAEGRAVGNKELGEYLEVRGYATAADGVYGRVIEPGTWSDGGLITLAEIRHIHRLAMTPVWDASPQDNLYKFVVPAIAGPHVSCRCRRLRPRSFRRMPSGSPRRAAA